MNFPNYFKKYLFFAMVFFATSLPAATVWVNNAQNTSTTTSPSPYENNSDTTTVLSISGASELTVTLQGVLESPSAWSRTCYDVVSVTDQSGSTQEFCGPINTSFTVQGDTITVRFASDGSITNSGVTVSITASAMTNTPPTDITLDHDSVDENKPAGTVVGTFAAVDSDPNEIFTYRLTNTNAYPANSRFTIDGDTLKTNEVFDYETQSTYQINVQVEDSAGNTYEKTFNIRINNLPEPVCHGCDCSLDDDSQNSSSPGVTIPSLDHVDTNVTTCLSGVSDDNDGSAKEDYYTFTVDTDGEFNLTTTSPNNHKYHLQVWVNGNEVYPDDPTRKNHFLSRKLRRGDQVVFRFKETGHDRDEYEAHLVFTAGAGGATLTGGDRPFSVRNPVDTRNIAGNYAIIGNANQCAIAQTRENPPWTGHCIESYSNDYASRYIDIDNDASTVNSSTSELNISTFVPHGAKVLWAGLYWQGVIHNSNKSGDFMGSPGLANGQTIRGEPVYSTNTQINFEQATSTYGAEKILFKVPGGSYTEVTADQFDFYKLGYSGFKNVTSMIDANNPNGVYAVANIRSNQGVEDRHGNYASWALVIIYEDVHEDFKNITLFDGYVTVDRHYNDDLVMSGFLTPRHSPINSKLALFAIDGDNGSNTFEIINEAGDVTQVQNQDHPGNALFDSTISNSIIRTPDATSLRTDLKVIDLVDVLNPMSTTATLRPRTGGDRYTPSFFIMSVDLIKPELCYDYDLRIGNYIKLASDDRNFTAQQWGSKDLQMKILIRSQEADFDFDNAKLHVTFTPDDTFEYRTGQSEISPEGINTYLPAVETDSSRGQIAIGHDYGPNGGKLGPEESTYVKQKFAFLKSSFHGNFDLHVEGNVTFTPTFTQHFTFSTDTGVWGGLPLDRCPTNPVYDPIWGSFNVENNASSLSDPESERYPLYTQIAGRNYSVRVVSYTKDANGSYTVVSPIHATVEMELIDVSPFDNNASAGYDSTCQEPVAASKGAFVKFDNEESVTVTPTDQSTFPDYDKQLVLRNAAFRIWVLTRDDGNGNRELVDHPCSSAADSSCFDQLYANVYASAEDNTTQYCLTDCTGSSGTTCYDCLRTYFARPVCSRDNFSIRPEGFRVVIRDTNETNDSTVASELSRNVSGKQSSRLVAGYNYQLKVEATSYDNEGEFNDPAHRAKAYYTRFKVPQSVNPLPANTLQRGKVILLDFNDSTACNDTNDSTMGLVMYDSITPSDQPTFVHSNVGHYGFRIVDGEWTRIDQGDYAYKPVFDPDCKTSPKPDKCYDCLLPGKTDPNKVECAIRSSYAGDPFYTDIALLFEPYRFDLSSIRFSTSPSNQQYLFMSNFDDEYYQSSASLANSMAAYYSGTVIAKSKDGKITTNFSDSCVATDVTLRLHRETNASEDDLKTLFGIEFQQYLQYGSSLASQTRFDDEQIGKDANLTLAKSAFEDTVNPGSASIRILTTFRKPAKDDILDGSEGINPIRVNYREINATDPDANASAHLGTHIPTGTQPQDSNVTFLYAKVTPNDKLYTEPGDRVATPLNIIIYCDRGVNACKEFDLNSSISMAHESSNWYLAANLFSNPSDLGSSDLNVSYYSGRTPGDAHLELNGTMPPAKTLTGVGYHLDGTQPDIIVSLPSGNPRPVTVETVYTSTPWLEYDLAEQYYRVRFIPQPTAWTGYGKTGHVVGDDISTSKTKRVEW